MRRVEKERKYLYGKEYLRRIWNFEVTKLVWIILIGFLLWGKLEPNSYGDEYEHTFVLKSFSNINFLSESLITSTFPVYKSAGIKKEAYCHCSWW